MIKIYKKDELSEKYNALESFETYKRPSSTSICDFLTEFDKRYNKTKSYGTVMSDDLLAYRLIKSANLPSSQEQLIRATVTELKFDLVRSKITKIFSDQSEIPSSDFENLNIKSEPTYYSQEEEQEPSVHFQDEYYTPVTTHQQSDEDLDTFYSSRHYQRGRQRTRFRAIPSYPRNNNSYHHERPRPPNMSDSRNANTRQQNHSATSDNWRSNYSRPVSTPPRKSSIKGKNPPDRYGTTTTCVICHSINHWAQQCPDADSNNQDHNTYIINDIVLHQSVFDTPNELKGLVSETWNAALLDCGASKTVCGKAWFDEYAANLSDQDRDSIVFHTSQHVYRFGDGKRVQAIKGAKIPALIGLEAIYIETDIVNSDIPLLFSKSSM